MRSVLVTGASSGIGRATAECFGDHGWTAWAGVRTAADAGRLEGARSGRLRAVKLDVTKAQTIDATRDTIASAGGLDAIVNNAGIGVSGPLELLTDAELRRQLDVNLVGQISVTRAMLPLLRSSSDPRVVFVSSLGGRVAFPFAGAYHASKFAIEAAADVLRVELEPDGIDVALVEPGPFSTEIWEKAESRIGDLRERDVDGRYRERLDGFAARLRQADQSGGDPEQVARAIVDVVEGSGTPRRTLVGARARLLGALRPLIPDAVFDRIARRTTSA